VLLNFIGVGNLQLLFLRSEQKMAAHNVEFTTKQYKVVMKFLFHKGKTTKEIYTTCQLHLTKKKSPIYSTVKNWVARFKTGHFSTKVEDHPRRPLMVIVPQNVDATQSKMLADRRISAKKIAATLAISR
jgi:hypothetical protein